MCLAAPLMAGQAKDASAELEALVMEYTRLEGLMDMQTQSKFIAPDRIWLGVGGRRTDNAIFMKVQEEGYAEQKKRYPNLRRHVECRDLHIRLIGDNVAVTSFVWYYNRIIPGDLPAEKVEMLGQDPVPNTMSLVWERRGSNWLIVNTHISPLYIRQ